VLDAGDDSAGLDVFPACSTRVPNAADETTDRSNRLGLSPRATLKVMPGGHDRYQEIPDAVASAVLTAVGAG